MTHVVVTGATRGIGLGLALAFARAGCRVTIAARKPDSLERALAQLADAGAVAAGTTCNVGSPAEMEALLQFAERSAPIDVWVNNAGRNVAAVPLGEHDLAPLAELVSTNLGGVTLGCALALRVMTPRGRGKIYNVEGFGADGIKLAGLAPYGATKAGVRYLSRALAREAKSSGVLVATVDPGVVATDALAALYPTLSPWVQTCTRALAQPASAVAPRLVRAMLDNRRSGVVLRATGAAAVTARLVRAMLPGRRALLAQ
jgi:NAD(P)-dependent dehydrogenase (short-subunit alcohol dehydrogenase family)